MSLEWSWWALASLVTCAVAWGAAVVVIRVRPDRSVNRRLALVLMLEGLFIGCSSGFLFLVDSPRAVFALGVVATAATVALVPQYLSFLAASLQTSLLAPFRGKGALVGLGALSVAGTLLVLLSPELFVEEPYRPSFARWNYQLHPWGQRVSQLYGLTALFGLVVALVTYFQTPKGSLRRTRALWFAVAFGLRDLYAGIFLVLYPVVRPIEFWGDFVYNPGLGGVYLLYVLLLTYGVLQAQLFDINIRIKLALRQSTVVGFITGAFFVGSEILEDFVPVDGMLLGVLAATACVLALRPLRKLSERLVNRVMEVEETPEYLERRRYEVYRTALEGIYEDDEVTEKERRVLDLLRTSLEIPDEVAARMEAEFQGEGGAR